MYLFSIFYGVNKRESMLEFGRHLAYFIVYLFASKFDEDNKHTKNILIVFLISGVLVVTIGIGTAAGTWNCPDAMLGGRLSGTFQYPNTLAAYVTVLYIISLALLNADKKFTLKFFYGYNMGIFLFSLVLSYSRAMWLIFPIVVTFYLIILPNDRKLESILYIVLSALVSLPSTFIFNKALENQDIKLWLIFIMCGLLSGISISLISKLEEKLRKVSIKTLFICLIVIIFIIFLLLLYIINARTDLTLENTTDTDKMTSVVRYLNNTIPENNYILKVHYVSKNNSESPYAGLIIIYNVDNNGELKQVASQSIVNSEENTIEIPFTTLKNSSGIRIYFYNYYKNTKITFKKAEVYEEYSLKLVKDVPLKFKYISEKIINRIQSIGIGESSFTTRITYNKDGLKIALQNPIFGVGGGGWLSLYQKYQSYSYWTTVAHNFVLQLWIDIGSLGLLLFILMIVSLFIYYIKLLKKLEDKSSKILVNGLLTVIITMILHGIVDFDMSFVAYSFVFWTIIGILVKQLKKLELKNKVVDKLNSLNNKFYSIILIIISIIITYNLICIIYSNKYKNLILDANKKNDLDSIIVNYEKIIKYDRLEPNYKINLANAYVAKYKETNDPKYINIAIKQSKEYEKLTPYNPEAYINLVSFNFSIGEIEKGLDLLEKSIDLYPMRIEAYINKINGYKSVINYYLSIGDIETAKNYLMKALAVKEEVNKIKTEMTKPWNINTEFIETIGELSYLYKNIDTYLLKTIQGLKLHFAYYFDIDINNDNELDMLYIYKPNTSQIKYESFVENDEQYIRILNAGETYGFVYVMPINLEPNTTYVAEIKARGTAKPETFSLYTWSNGAKEPNQGGLTNIELDENWKTYTFEFTTDSDIESGKQYFRIQHNGKDSGYIDIKDLVIYSKIGG